MPVAAVAYSILKQLHCYITTCCRQPEIEARNSSLATRCLLWRCNKVSLSNKTDNRRLSASEYSVMALGLLHINEHHQTVTLLWPVDIYCGPYLPHGQLAISRPDWGPKAV